MNFIFEVTLLMISPIPYYDRYITYEDCKDGITVHYLLSEFLVAIMILRMYFLIRTFFNFSLYADAISKKICKNYGFEAGVRYTIKCLIIVNPEVTVLSFFFGSLFIGAYIVRIFEMPYYREVANGPGALDGYFGAIYLVTITITTVGYGDISATNTYERWFCSVIMLIGVISFSFANGSLGLIITQMNTKQSIVFEKIQVLDKIKKNYNMSEELYKKCKRTLEYT